MTADEAIALLPNDKKIHTFLGMFGADWPRAKLVAAIRKSKEIVPSTGMARALGHRLSIEHDGRWLAIQTRDEQGEPS